MAASGLWRDAQGSPELEPLARQLAAQCWGLVPGFHRLTFEDGRVLLTVCIGEPKAMLQAQAFEADSRVLRGLEPHHRPPRPATGRTTPGRALVIGAGLSGAASAASLARRGWQVQVLDTDDRPAAGASSLPAGLLAPHTSPDDNLLSRLTRAGVRIGLQQARALLREGVDWQPGGAQECRRDDAKPAADQGPGGEAWQRPHGPQPAHIWHEAAGWIRPATLVRAWLAQPGIAWRGGTAVAGLQRAASGWQAIDAQGKVLAEADLVVVAAATASAALLEDRVALTPVRGQVSLGLVGAEPLPSHPLNGHGHLLPHVPLEAGLSWLCGSTYGRKDTSLEARDSDHQANLERMRVLAPATAAALQRKFDSGAVQAWTGVRCASADRRPLVGELEPGLWVSTAMGSRGLTFAKLCAELIAARLHGEPLPLPVKLAAALDVARHAPARRG